MITRLINRPITSILLCVTLCSGAAVFAQDANTTKTTVKMADGEDQYPDLWEFDPFGGIQAFGQVNRGLDNKISNGGVFGGRIAYNPYKYLGLELWMDYSIANNQFGQSNGTIPAGLPGAGGPVSPYGFGARNWTFGFNPVWNLRPRGSKVQPYLTAGVEGIQFTPTSKAINLANQPDNIALYGAQALNDNLQVGFNVGGGVKWHFTDHLGARFDVRTLFSRNPTYDLPGGPDGGGVYIPGKSHLDGVQATLGLVFYAGERKCPPMPAAPPAPGPLPTPSISGGDGSASGAFCSGKPVTLHASITAPDRTLGYAWTINGQAQSSTTPDLTFTPTTGTTNAQLTVTDTTPPPAPMERPKKFPVRCWVQPPAPAPVAPVTAAATVTLNESAPTITSVSASPNTLGACGPDGPKTSTLTAVAQPSACGGDLTYKWTVSEGSVTNDSTPNATFDVSSLTFEQSAQAQSKSVIATLTVTDQSGKTASQTTPITVNCTPQFVRLDDLIFAKNNARVNNCAKRLLIDDAASRMANGDYDIILVGHRDTDEEARIAGHRRGRRAAAKVDLDEERVMNAAAVLSGGTATCGKVDVSRIKIDTVGTDQTSETRPGSCGTSNTKERKGSETSEADKNRRVEIYLVPHGSTVMPPAVKNARPVPEPAVKALGCPH
jgi:opacity protein-like surface antigen/outer membrane protein OmpA-like peptidoglycan-associated protein